MKIKSLILISLILILFSVFPVSAVENGGSFDLTYGGNRGITTNGDYFWITDFNDSEVYVYNYNGIYTDTSWDTAASGNTDPSGITMNETYFWITDTGFDPEVYQYYHNGTYTSIHWDTNANGNGFPSGITMNETYFWITDVNDGEVYKYYHNGTYISSWDTAASDNLYPNGITMDDTYFWISNYYNDEVYKYYHNGTYISSWDTAARGNEKPRGIVKWRYKYYVIDSDDAKVYIYYELGPPELYYPLNASNIYGTYPPMTYSIDFTWESYLGSNYRLLVARDNNFNLISVDTHIGTNHSTQSLTVNDEYFWKVYSYNGVTYSDASDTYSFNLTGNTTISGSAVYGTIYSASGLLSNAEIILSNASDGVIDQQITGSNGYYQFDSLTPGIIYTLTVSRDLFLGATANFNATVDPQPKDFYLFPDKTSEEWRHDVTFVVQSIWVTRYKNVNVNAYLNSDVTPALTGVTGSDGSVTFYMNKNQQHRLTFINSSQGISETRVLYPSDSKYYIIVSSTFNNWNTYTVPISEGIDFTISKSIINSTHAYINFSYVDHLTQTTSLTVDLNQTSDVDYFNQTNLDSFSGAGNNSHSFIVTNYAGQAYLIHLQATHTTYGLIDSTYSISFKSDISSKFPGLPPSIFLYASVFILLFFGGIFMSSNVEKGMLLVCVMNTIFIGLGSYNSLPSSTQTAIVAGTVLAFIISLVANLNKSNKDEGFS